MNFPVIRATIVSFCYVNEVTIDHTYGWGLVARRNNHAVRGLELSISSSIAGVGKRGMEVESAANVLLFK